MLGVTSTGNVLPVASWRVAPRSAVPTAITLITVCRSECVPLEAFPPIHQQHNVHIPQEAPLMTRRRVPERRGEVVEVAPTPRPQRRIPRQTSPPVAVAAPAAAVPAPAPAYSVPAVKYESGESVPSCKVCFESFNGSRVLMLEPCHHSGFCDECVRQWSHIKKTCPICRTPFTAAIHIHV